MRMYAKYLALIMAMLMLALCVAACGNTQKPDDTTAAPAVDDTTVGTEDTEEVVDKPDVPQGGYNGRDFTVMYPTWSLYTNFLFCDAENAYTGDNVSAAIYERTVAVNEYLDVNIKHYTPGGIGEIFPALQTQVLAGDPTYDLVLTHCKTSLAATIAGGLVLPWSDIKYVDLDSNLWNQTVREMVSLNDLELFAVNDFIIPDVNFILFNPEMITERGLANPYELVTSGNWTLDKFIELSTNIYTDNGDGVKGEGDVFGFVTEASWKSISIQIGIGQPIMGKDADGVPIFVMQESEKMYQFLDKLNTFYNGQDVIWTGAGKTPPVNFSDGGALFFMRSLEETLALRSSDSDFGILPMPKWDVSQEDYISLNWTGFMCIPKTVSDADLVGKVSTMLAYENNQRVMPEFFDVLLGQKLASDPESQEMLNIIFENTVYDMGIVLDAYWPLQRCIQANNTDLASRWASDSGPYLNRLDQWITAYADYAAKAN